MNGACAGDQDGAGDGEVVYEFGDMFFAAPNLDVPAPPRDLPYQEREDYQSIQLLLANDISTEVAPIAQALKVQSGVLLAAAAHAAGSLGFTSTSPVLRDVIHRPDDVAAAEAAYALARLGDEQGRSALREAVRQPLGPNLGPVLAAGFLAQLGEPTEAPVVQAALDSEFLATRMLAAKQLYFFVDADVSAEVLDEVFGAALHHLDPAIQRQALAELRYLRAPASRPLLERYRDETHEESRRELAEEILRTLP